MAKILDFPVRRVLPVGQQTGAAAPTVAKQKFTEQEYRLIDKIKMIADHSIDVVNAGDVVMRGFLDGKMGIQADFTHNGRRLRVTTSLEVIDDLGPRVA